MTNKTLLEVKFEDLCEVVDQICSQLNRESEIFQVLYGDRCQVCHELLPIGAIGSKTLCFDHNPEMQQDEHE